MHQFARFTTRMTRFFIPANSACRYHAVHRRSPSTERCVWWVARGVVYLINMPNRPAAEIELLRAAYAAFNARNIDAALALMTPDVAWPKAFKGGFVRGPEEVRAYWTEQWSEIDPHVEPIAFHAEDGGPVLVEVHQVVRDLAGAVLADEHVGHRFTIEHGLIQAMEVWPLLSSGPRA